LKNQKVLENYYGTPKILYGLAKRTGKTLFYALMLKEECDLKKDLKAKK